MTQPPGRLLRPADNPFRASRIDAVPYRLEGERWPEIVERLARMGGRAAVVGPHGSGKTAFLSTLADHLGAVGIVPAWVRLHSDTRRPLRSALAQLPPSGLHRKGLLVDGAEQLGIARWWAISLVTRRAELLVASRHRPGHLPTLYRCTTSPALLAELVAELAPGDACSFEPLLGDLFRRHGGNLRDCLRALYDVWGGRSTATPSSDR